jgi:hypothetical protein
MLRPPVTSWKGLRRSPARADAEHCGRLIGAAEGLHEAVGVPVYVYYEPHRSIYRRTMVAVRSRLGEGGSEEARAEGHAMTFEQAIEYALNNKRTVSLSAISAHERQASSYMGKRSHASPKRSNKALRTLVPKRRHATSRDRPEMSSRFAESRYLPSGTFSGLRAHEDRVAASRGRSLATRGWVGAPAGAKHSTSSARSINLGCRFM